MELGIEAPSSLLRVASWQVGSALVRTRGDTDGAPHSFPWRLLDPASRCSSLHVFHKCLLDHSHGPQPSLIPFAAPWGPAAHGDKGRRKGDKAQTKGSQDRPCSSQYAKGEAAAWA